MLTEPHGCFHVTSYTAVDNLAVSYARIYAPFFQSQVTVVDKEGGASASHFHFSHSVMDLPEQDRALLSPAFYPSVFTRNELIVYYSLCGLPVADIQKMLREVHGYGIR